jgi:hypothetical protein
MIPYNSIQLEGLCKLVELKHHFAKQNQGWLEQVEAVFVNSQLQYSHALATLVNTFCAYELPDNDYMSIHLEASHYGEEGNFENALQSVPKICKHLTYIIWTDKFVDGYLVARVKDLTMYQLLDQLEVLLPLIFLTTT